MGSADTTGSEKKTGANGKWPAFDEMSPELRKEFQRRGHAVQRAKREARKLAELEAWAEAHREAAGELFDVKMATIRGIVAEGTVEVTDESGFIRQEFQPKLVGEKQLTTLLKFIENCERAGFKSEVKKEQNTQVNVLAIVSDLKKALGQ